MLEPSVIFQTILSAQYLAATKIETNRASLAGGNLSADFTYPKRILRLTRAVKRQYDLADYSSPNFLFVYDKLCGIIGMDTVNNTIDPNSQGGGVVVVTVPVLQNFNSDKIPFVTTSEHPQLILANYNLNYAPLYGDNPDLAVYVTTDDYTGDSQTPPTLTYSTPGDETSNITQILWDYGVATTGYIQISGIGTVSSGSPSSGGGVVPLAFYFTQDDLLYDSVLDQYYLSLILPGTRRPFYASINGDSIPLNYSASSGRFNGFANNLPVQNIEIDLM